MATLVKPGEDQMLMQHHLDEAHSKPDGSQMTLEREMVEAKPSEKTPADTAANPDIGSGNAVRERQTWRLHKLYWRKKLAVMRIHTGRVTMTSQDS
ncbi:hypothetical protein GUJ93_ZPchr0001g32010 [Zizania palustris]|uniref:Uncharacterized protein n=1 Tax=Zizania palustris TaxID=103762 RepID=A0A8J5S7H1_ZIZPA|nr:hypothetical protein GUJ93_ZPchr0001g32010 [Zizania palustris]